LKLVVHTEAGLSNHAWTQEVEARLYGQEHQACTSAAKHRLITV
jgi:hypothetical protein